MPTRYVPKIIVVAGTDLRREPFVPTDFFQRDDWRCGIRGCEREATTVIARPLGGHREFFGVSCAEHLASYEQQLSEALEAEAKQAAEFDTQAGSAN